MPTLDSSRLFARSFAVLVLVAGSLTGTALASPASEAGAIEPAQVGSGELLWKDAGGFVPLPVVDVDVELTVTGILLHGAVRQTFRNPTDETIEVLYAFPLPDRAAVHRMEMIVGDRRIRSVAREREAARRTYEQAKAGGRKTALLDQHRPNLFTASAANINPGETVTVELEYLEELPCEDGLFRLHFPLSFTSGPAWPSARVRASIRPGFPVGDVESVSHEIVVVPDATGFEVTTKRDRVVADRDFRLRWALAGADVPMASVFVERRDGSSYALLMVVPPTPGSEAGAGLPTETLFVIDVSGSMAGPSIEQAREALLAALGRLRPDDTFNILRFNDGNAPFRETFQTADGEALEAAAEWVRGLGAGGGTKIYPALMRGLDMLGQSRSSRAQRLIFLTDGAVANEDEVLRGIAEHLGRTRLHSIGIGHAPNAYLMRKMAWFGRGISEFVASPEESKNRIDRFFERIDRPVMTDLELSWEDISVEALYPTRMPDLHAGQPLVLYARLDGDAPSGSLRLSGYTRAGWIDSEASLAAAPPGPGLATRWARARVDALMDSLHEGGSPDDVRDEVIEVGLEFNLVTPYTSLIAVEETPTALGPAIPTRGAAGLPLGGTDGPLRRRLGWLLVISGLVGLVTARALGRS